MLKGVSFSDKLLLPHVSPTSLSVSGAVSVTMDKNTDNALSNSHEGDGHEDQNDPQLGTNGTNGDFDIEQGGVIRGGGGGGVSTKLWPTEKATEKATKYQKTEKPEKPSSPSSSSTVAGSLSVGGVWRQRWRRLGLFQEVKGGGRDDVVAGLTVGVMNIPSAIAFTTIAQLPPVVGLYSAAVSLLTYPALGSSRHLSVSPVAILWVTIISFFLFFLAKIHLTDLNLCRV